jgi:hypothetical protein
MIYVVLGMHKSGTSLVSSTLHHSGIDMGNDLESKEGEYDKYERKSVFLVNQEILGSEGVFSLNIEMPAVLKVTEEQRSRMISIVQACEEQFTHWGFKDPRTCLVYPLWADVLPKHNLIVVYRSPSEIWPRVRSHSLNPTITFYRAWRLIKRWVQYNTRIQSYLEETSMDYLILNYRDLMTTHREFDRFQAFVGKKLSDQRKRNLYRGKSNEYFLLESAAWLHCIQAGYHYRDILKKFEALRRM